MISFPAVFFALSSVALLAALAAIWSSLRAALGGGPRVVIATSRDLPDHAALVDEKNSLLRAIKDLEYEHAVGKIGEADFERLDAAYRARAKQVLVQLDRDVKPLYEEAELLIAQRLSGADAAPGRSKKRSSKRKDAPGAPSIERVSIERVSVDRAAPSADEPTLLDEILAAIRAGEITTPPEPPADWPEAAKQFFVDAVRRAIAETRAEQDAAETETEAETEHETELRSPVDTAADEAPAATDEEKR
ncbi:MAG: hypothetical protein M3Y87_13975 [Myxococcota bacterium]|nr:hypothetical protein [Myxococcota bacterium]